MNQMTDGQLMERAAKGDIDAMCELRRRWASAAAAYQKWRNDNPGRYMAAK